MNSILSKDFFFSLYLFVNLKVILDTLNGPHLTSFFFFPKDRSVVAFISGVRWGLGSRGSCEWHPRRSVSQSVHLWWMRSDYDNLTFNPPLAYCDILSIPTTTTNIPLSGCFLNRLIVYRSITSLWIYRYNLYTYRVCVSKPKGILSGEYFSWSN